MSNSFWWAIGFRGRKSIHIHTLRVLNSFVMCKYRRRETTFFGTCQHRINLVSSCFKLFPQLTFPTYIWRVQHLYTNYYSLKFFCYLDKSRILTSRTMIMIFRVTWFHVIDVIGWLGQVVKWIVIVWSIENLDVHFIQVSNRVLRSLINSHSDTSRP